MNILESINHFQYKELGVKLFYEFLCEKLDRDQFLYFLVLRALLLEMIGQTPILQPLSKSKIMETNKISNCSHIEGVVKLKWNPSEIEIEEFLCHDFLNISSINKSSP